MPSAVYIAVFFVLTLGYTQGAIAKEDGVPGRRVGGGTRLEFPGRLPHTHNQGDCRQSLVGKAVKTEGTIATPAHS